MLIMLNSAVQRYSLLSAELISNISPCDVFQDLCGVNLVIVNTRFLLE